MDGRRARIVLGVRSDSGPPEIRRAFRARALAVHPDHGGDRAAFAELVDALGTLDSLAYSGATPRHDAPAPEPIALPQGPRRFDAYDSPRGPAPRRDFADVLRAATARLG